MLQMKKRSEVQIKQDLTVADQFRVTLVAPEAHNWLRRGLPAQVLHVFAGNINLIHQDGEIMSLVQPMIGPGPFSAVVDVPAGSQADFTISGIRDFTEAVDIHSTVRVRGNILEVGDLSVLFDDSIPWDPIPAWHQVKESDLTHTIDILEQSVIDRAVVDNAFIIPNEGQLLAFHNTMIRAWDTLSTGLRQRDSNLCREGAGALAGLGSGFTPAGDDFLVGVIYALYAAAGNGSAHFPATIIAEEASPKTTRLSAAWLRAAMRGEATDAWHSLVTALASKDSGDLAAAARRIKETGHSSGVAALAGFVNGLKALGGVA